MKKLKLLTFTLIAFLFIGVVNVNAVGTDHIDSKLTDGKLVLKSIPLSTISNEATRGEAFYFVITKSLGTDYSFNNCNDSYTTCDIIYRLDEPDGETKKVNIEYVYDKTIKAKVDEYITKLNGKKSFIVSDLEMVNYWVNKTDDSTLLSFSEEYKSYFDYANFIPMIEIRGGGGTGEFTDSGIGFGVLVYDGTMYYMEDGFGAFSRNIIYVPSDTSDAEIMTAVKARIDAYVGEGVVAIEEINTVESYIDGYLQTAKEQDDDDLINSGYSNNYYSYALSAINDEDGELHFLKDDNIAPNYYMAAIGEESNIQKYYFVVIKDSTKVTTPKYKTSDLKSNITVESSDITIPLDTIVNVEKLTSGETYDSIIKTLKVDPNNSAMFDFTLFSASANEFITKSENGFEVGIPIEEDFKGKSLTVYHITDEGTIESYETILNDLVNLTNGSYTAKTWVNHFSIYTLVATENIASNEENPQTGDGIMSSVLIGSASIIGLMVTAIYLKKKERFN